MKKSAAATEKKSATTPEKKRTHTRASKTTAKAAGKPTPLPVKNATLSSTQQVKKVAILSLGAVLASALLVLLLWLLITVEFSVHFNDSQTITRRAFTIIEWATGKREAAE